jgi:alpha-amylase
MSKLKFIFGVHNHQPVGNFDFVFEEAYQKAYRPFLETVAQYPWFRFTLHNSGCLWEWLEGHHPEYLDQVNALVRSGQVELMGGGFYEPILPAIPEEDRRGQLEMMSRYLQEKFGLAPQGAWVAERVWEPGLASTLAGAGLRYTVLDDYHFKCAGRLEHQLNGRYLTEDQGRPLSVFPISQQLRYLIPFHDVAEAVAHLRELYDSNGSALAVLADDGEKFGIWPGTHELAYGRGWLRSFLEALQSNRDWIETATFSDCLGEPPLGTVYLPTGSYAEMGEWVLEPESGEIYRELAGRLKAEGSYQRYGPFVRGGIWRNFLVKYPESNNIYRKMLHVSRKCRNAGEQAIRELYRGQCNCGYWHGIFGGLYLPHLREALYRHLIRAENLAGQSPDRPRAESLDFDGDGREEILLTNRRMNLYVSPAAGGSVFEWDIREKEINLFDTLARRPESYHRLVAGLSGEGEGQGKSIHETLTAKEDGLEKLLSYDRSRRVGLLDHLLSEDATLEQLAAGRSRDQDGTLCREWTPELSVSDSAVGLKLVRRSERLEISKTLGLAEGAWWTVCYRWRNLGDQALALRPGVEFNFGLLSAGQGRYCSSRRQLSTPRLDRPSQDTGLTDLAVHDEHRRLSVTFGLDRAWDLWRFPVETVSQSEAGLERNYQCSCFLWHAGFRLEPGQEYTLNIKIGIEEV